MDKRDYDIWLPWQFVLLAFTTFIALLVLATFSITFFADDFRSSTRHTVLVATLAYMSFFALTAPPLFIFGRRRARKLAAQAADPDSNLPASTLGRTVRVSKTKGIILCSIALAIGLLMIPWLIASTSDDRFPLTLWALDCILIIGGLFGIRHHATRLDIRPRPYTPPANLPPPPTVTLPPRPRTSKQNAP